MWKNYANYSRENTLLNDEPKEWFLKKAREFEKVPLDLYLPEILQEKKILLTENLQLI